MKSFNSCCLFWQIQNTKWSNVLPHFGLRSPVFKAGSLNLINVCAWCLCYIERYPNGSLDPNLPKCGKKKCTSTDHLLFKKQNMKMSLIFGITLVLQTSGFMLSWHWPCCFDRIRRILLTQSSLNIFCFLLFFILVHISTPRPEKGLKCQIGDRSLSISNHTSEISRYIVLTRFSTLCRP